MAGPYEEITPRHVDPELPNFHLRFFFRSSLHQYAKNTAEPWFKVTR